ncbi:MAG TPA: ABC transporter ATP-binding protein [Candidatus Bipolaricaulis sp.]|nr:ABC transporter ATP-binding protein [Candidatus Bipolaricaulis sp.]MDY0392497.1 ABC transporter ATP-binding protein [Candidatus Bipolaricaulis sp.]HPD06407.1 ABC transporter ATP-binding protein [Candidatus Bipolaricaulis sp.]HRS14123.1 ABC transporter ATP-binding protein [Candidatus Bipolaricaulis sp.]HRU21804.1 ABC transporter ATP-binding protein [Candidatus Bipolaricaulis sp.]
MIEVADLTKEYPNGTRANAGLSLTVNEGEIVGVIGPNGAGKTTLIRQLLGLLKPTSGRIRILGCDVVSHPHMIKGRVGYVPQAPLTYPSLTVAEVISFVLGLKGLRGAGLRERVMETLTLVGLEQSAGSFGYQLSRGMARLVLLGMAICQNPPVLILDEPTAMVDIERKERVWHAITASGARAVVLASHDIHEVREHCTRVYLMVGGKFIAEGPPHEIAALTRLSTVLTIVADDSQRVEELLVESGDMFRRKGDVFEIVFPELVMALSRLELIRQGIALRYVHLEAPSLERAVKQLLLEGRVQ